MTEIPFTTPNLAGSESENFTQYDVFLSDSPEVVTRIFTVAASQNLAAMEVVGLDGSGHIIPAVLGTTPAIGFTTAPISSGGTPTETLAIFIGGHVDIDGLVWDATYDTDAKKLAAFDAAGASQPSRILADTNKYNRKP